MASKGSFPLLSRSMFFLYSMDQLYLSSSSHKFGTTVDATPKDLEKHSKHNTLRSYYHRVNVTDNLMKTIRLEFPLRCRFPRIRAFNVLTWLLYSSPKIYRDNKLVLMKMFFVHVRYVLLVLQDV